MSRLHAILPALATGLLLAAGAALLATDPPHNISTANSYGALNYCSTCHKLHGAPGGTLTTVSGNTNLCLSCHVSGGRATNQAFAATDQAVPAGASLVGSTAGGTSHRWDSGAQGRLIKGSPNTSTGTITPSGDYTGAYAATIKIQVVAAGATGSATVAWSQTTNGTATFGGATTITTSTTAQALGSSGVSVAFSSTGTFVAGDLFYLYVRPDLVQPASAMASHLESGRSMCSTCHDQHLQALTPFDPAASQTYTAGTTNNRHFQRVANDGGALCGDCHAPRNVGKGGTSHPVNLPVAGAANTKTPTTVPLTVSGNVHCLTCHDVHKASTTTTPAGMLLRVSNTTALCADCHTLADTTTANTHTNPTSGILWPGDQYGGSTYAAITDTTLRGACKNCHTPHGWPDANNPGGKYANALGAEQDNLCLTCHDADGPSTKDVRTQITKTIHHPVERNSGRTVGCADCHNPHMATAGVHTYTTTATLDRNRLRASGGGVLNNMYALRGVDGVAFNYSGLAMWGVPTSANFTKIAGGSPTVAASGAEFEYQVCFKCHTSYSWGTNPAPNGITSGGTSPLTLVSGTTQPWVAGTGTASFTSGSTSVTGSGTSWNAPSIRYMYIRHVGYTGTLRYVSTVTSNTAVTLSGTYGTTASAKAYELRDSAAITGTTTVTGYGTTWDTSLVNQFFAMTAGNTTSYRITAVPNATTLTITTATTSTTPQDFYIHPGASFTNGSTAVVGYGTSWTSALVGNTIQASGVTGTYTITAVADATHLTLSGNFTGTTGVYRFLLAGPILLQETDLAQEFNPANRSGHPVVTGLNNYTGSTAPKALAAATMKAPWATNLGTQTMMCSDCHNTDAATPAAQGPHGSAAQFMLRGTNPANWPNITLSSASTSWCTNCHTLTLSNNTAHNTGNHSGYQCWNCHIVIPHGGKMSRLIGYSGTGTTMPARYAYNNTVSNMKITGFKKPTSATGYSQDGSCQTSCYHNVAVTSSETW
ncbi:cytochrome c3 family protein [Geothrix mesophila]|uniref:cytochrome c3 family protein n=1 Tax=Geothrix mesophila TaxID=2922723 RepID=UPI001FAC403D